MATAVRSYAKVNLGLAIGPVRPDGYHALATLYQTIALHDLVTVSARPLPSGPSQLTLRSNDRRVPTDARNTAWRMVELCLERLQISAEVTIEIDKRLPIQGGLGAGSANAAAALLALERELGTVGIAPLPGHERLSVAAAVGSDVPLFLIGGSVLGLSHGEEVYPMPEEGPGMPCVIAVPSVGVSTPHAFRDWDALMSSLTPEAEYERLRELSRIYSSSLIGSENIGLLSAAEVVNDFERVVFEQQPSLRETKRHLAGTEMETAAVYAALSGSGSALFGLYRSGDDARAAQQRVQQQPGVQAFVTATLPRADYWRTIYPETSAQIAG